ncbi:Ig-like domain-containing protein [Rhodococcus opacus]|uniref:Ig-like domain-containing protein n=1 Tax=Rhodococcus opacus TaxID=37919 RepID=UPI0029C3270E|nr:Ig-like domain-containing protein [Rhodococcus opacus]MDX5961944.1 Ig-like domain-containing protein [Rhodococcus opacus]
MNTRPPRRTPILLALAILIAVLAACAPSGTGSSSSGGAGPSAPVDPDPAITVTPADRADTVNPADPVSVETAGGTLETVTMTNNEGKVIDGIFTPDRITWKPGVPLGYGKTYTIAATALHDGGTRTDRTSTFSTVKPGNLTQQRQNGDWSVPWDQWLAGSALA